MHEEENPAPSPEKPEGNGVIPESENNEKIPPRKPKASFFFSLVKSRVFWFNALFFTAACLLFFKSAWVEKQDLAGKMEGLRIYARENFPALKEKLREKVLSLVPGKEKAGGGETAGGTASTGESKKPKKKIKYWQGPMNPSYIRDKPGKSPMGMDLIPVYEDEGGKDAGGGIRIDPATVQNIGVKTEIIKRRTLKREIRTVGRMTYNEKKVYHIHTKFKGWIEKLHVDYTGQEVKKDELLLEIYSPEVVSTEEEYLQALSFKKEIEKSPFSDIARGASSTVEAARKRLMLWDIPKHQIDELFEKKKVFKSMHIHSPERGFVVEKNAQEGMFVKPGMNLYTIADISTIWVNADVYEYELPWVRVGQSAAITLSYFPGKVFRGKVTFIYPFLEQKTRTVKVRIEFPNPDWKLKPDMYANVTIKSTLGRNTVAVPEEAVLHSGKRNVVLLARKGGRFESRDVILGVNTEGYYQVKKGVKAGEKVVTSAQFLIDSESKLQEAIQKMLGGKK